MTENTVEENGTPGFNKWVAFGIIAMALMTNSIDGTIVATALHTLQQELHTTVSWAGWTITGYAFGFVVALPISAKLSTQFGHRKVFVWSMAIFTGASVLCGLSTNIYMLIAMRAVQALGGAGVTPAATGIIVEHFGKSRAQFLGLFGSMFATGAILGPIFGGLFVTYLSWQWIFFVNLPLGLAVVLLCAKIIPSDAKQVKIKEPMDFRGAILMAISIISGMYGANYLGAHPSEWKSPLFIGLVVLSGITFLLLTRHLYKTSDPLVMPRFIFGKGFGAVNLFNVLFSGFSLGLNALVPLYAINRYGISVLDSGTLLMANGAASVVLSTIMSIYINKTGYRMPLYLGTVLIALGFCLLALPPQFGFRPYYWLMFCSFFIGVGFGVNSPAGRNAGIQLAPDQSANIAAVRSLGMETGQIISVAVATAIIAASADGSVSQAKVFITLAVFLVLIVYPVISKVPESKGGW